MATFRKYWSWICEQRVIQVWGVLGPWGGQSLTLYHYGGFCCWTHRCSSSSMRNTHTHTHTEGPWYKSYILLGKASPPAIRRFFVAALSLDAAVERCKCVFVWDTDFHDRINWRVNKSLTVELRPSFSSYLQTVNLIWLFLPFQKWVGWEKNSMCVIG